MPEPGRHSRTIRQLKEALGWTLRLGTCAVAAGASYIGYKYFENPGAFTWSIENLIIMLQGFGLIYMVIGFVCVMSSLAGE